MIPMCSFAAAHLEAHQFLQSNKVSSAQKDFEQKHEAAVTWRLVEWSRFATAGFAHVTWCASLPAEIGIIDRLIATVQCSLQIEPSVVRTSAEEARCSVVHVMSVKYLRLV